MKGAADALTGLRDGLDRWTRDRAVNLAVFRITVGLVVLWVQELHTAGRQSASVAASLRAAPVGMGWLAPQLPVTDALATAAWIVVQLGAIAGTLGLASRTSFTLLTLSGLYLWGLPQLVGAVFHYHHLLWFCALLAVSPCGDALSVDRWLADRRGAPPPCGKRLAYGIPIRAAWLLIAAIYFFPGLWKVLTSGIDWIASDNLRNQMYAKWMQKPDFEPLVRIDRIPWLVRGGALATVGFELAFPFLIFFRRTRPWAVAGALAFHQATRWIMDLAFPALWLCYTVFFDWTRGMARVRRWLPPRSMDFRAEGGLNRSAVPAGAMAAVLCTGALFFGAHGESQGWPFACYPKFDRIADARLPALEVELVHRDGHRAVLPRSALFPGGMTQRAWALTWSLMGSYERSRTAPERFRDFWLHVSARPPIAARARDAVAVRFHRVYLSTVPERRGDPPLARELLYELDL